MDDLGGKTAIVTGASRGIGRAIALGLARAGVDVAIAARTEQERRNVPGTIGHTADEVRALGVRALAIPCDVRDEAIVQAMVERVQNEWGRVDVLVNNAALGSYRHFTDLSLEEWDRVFAVNVRGLFLCTRAVMPLLRAQGGGSIVNLSSTAADGPFSMTVDKDNPSEIKRIGTAYGASKAAVERFSRGLAVDLGRFNIAVNALKPIRPVLTEGMKVQRAGADMSGWLGPEMMVAATVFLAAQDAQGVTGVVTTDAELIYRHNLPVDPPGTYTLL